MSPLRSVSPTAARRRAIRNSIFGQMAGGIMPTLMREGGVASLLIIALTDDDSKELIGLAYLIMQWSMLARLLVAPRIDLCRRKRFLQRWLAGAAVLSALLVLGPLLGLAGRPTLAVWAFLFLLATYFLALQTGVTAWFPLLAHIVPAQLRGRYFGNMRRAWQITSFGAVFLSGALLGKDPGMLDFVWILAAAAVLQFVRVLIFNQLPDPPPARSDHASFAWRAMFVPLRNRPFLGFVVFTLCMGILQFAAVPFIVPFLRTELNFPADITLYGSGCFGLGSVLSLTYWGRLADRGGTRVVFLLSGLTAVAALFTVATCPQYASTPAAAVTTAIAGMLLAGAGAAGIGIAYTVRLMRMAPETHASPYLNLGQAAIGLSGGLVAALIGALLGWLPEQLPVGSTTVASFRLLFLGVGAFLGIALFGLRRLPRLGEPALHAALSELLTQRPKPPAQLQ